MKAIIPVAGAGINLRPLTYTQPKPLIPVAGKPIIAFIIDQLILEGVTEYIFVLGYLGEKIKQYIDETYSQLSREYVYQEERKGLGHAIWTTRMLLKDQDEILIFLGDTIVETDIKDFVNSPTSRLGIKKVKDPRQFGVVELDDKGDVVRVVEKPAIPKSNLAIVGLYKIKEVQSLIQALQYNITNDITTKGEFHLTDGIMKMIESGCIFRTQEVNNWFDCGQRDILLETNAMLLDKGDYDTVPLDGFERTIIIPPVSIGHDCNISDSIIGPHVTIGSNTAIHSSIIQSSIIGNYSKLEIITLKNSVVGNDAAIKGISQSLNIGDNTEIDLS